jgi:hypothetical protein
VKLIDHPHSERRPDDAASLTKERYREFIGKWFLAFLFVCKLLGLKAG